MPIKGSTKVLVAMSGGVDSSVAAALLQRKGYNVVGCFMRLGSPGDELDAMTPFDAHGHSAQFDDEQVSCDPAKIRIGKQGCCSINDAADARLVAAELDIPFYVCNFKKDFGRIIDYFVDEYAAGRTPNPCVRCNDWLKFGKLHEYAKQIDADFVASGHYARIEQRDGLPRLLRGVDQSKDQSYVLFGAPRDRLREMLLPIGELEKPHVREMALEFGLPVFDKPDSQEICFVPDQDYAGLVERRKPDLAQQGEILDTDGNIIGAHDGQHHYTIGQRRGVNLAMGYPIYVVGKDAAANTITVGSVDELLSESCIAGEANWLIPEWELERFSEPQPVFAKYRYNTPVARAMVHVLDDETQAHVSPSGRLGRFEVVFDEPQRAVTAGQAIVLYDADEPEVVLGGGWIANVQTSCALSRANTAQSAT